MPNSSEHPLPEERASPMGEAVFRLTEDDILEFQQLVRDTAGVWITPEIAAARANALLTLTRIMVGPLAEDTPAGGVRTSSHLPDST